MKSSSNKIKSFFQSFVFLFVTLQILSLILIIGAIIFANLNTNRLTLDLTNLNKIEANLSELREMRNLHLEQEVALAQAIIFNSSEELQEHLPDHLKEWRHSIQDYISFNQGVALEVAFLIRLAKIREEIDPLVIDIIKFLGENKPTEALSIYQNKYLPVAEKLEELLSEKIDDSLEDALLQEQAKIRASLALEQTIFLIGGTFLGLFLVAIGLTLILILINRINRLRRVVEQISKGNLEARVHKPGADELGQVGKLLNQMAERVQQLLEDVKAKQALGQQAIAKLDEVVVQLSGAINEQSNGVTSQSSSINQLTAGMEEMSLGARNILERTVEVAHRAQDTQSVIVRVKDMAQGTNQAALNSQESFSQSKTIVGQVEDNLGQARQTVRQLAEQAKQIASIIHLVSEIANETQLLSLNASIEAAGAGVYGERFGVVASEVKALAMRTRNATSEVTNVIRGTTEKISDLEKAIELTSVHSQMSVELSEQAVVSIDSLRDFTERIDTYFREVDHSMGIVTGLTGQITSTISEQNNSNGQFLEGMRQIRNGSMQIANSSIQITEMSQQLKELSRDLNQNLLRNY